jgi:Mce-associated membrane protein
VRSLREDEVPTTAEDAERERLLSVAREFATRFNTYGPEMLDDAGHLPDYATLSELMTAKFGDVFSREIGAAEKTVSQLGVERSAEVYAVGVAAQDLDSAEVLVAGTIEISYPVPGQGGGQEPGEAEEEPRVSTGPQRFRYQVSLVKVEGSWLVDDLDDVDDGLPAFSQAQSREQPTSPAPTSPPSPTTDAPNGEGAR